MSEPFENQYFNWLCAKVLPTNGQSYYKLMEILHRTPFTWVVEGDANRAEDGQELRTYFLNESRIESDSNWFNEPCSVLEMLVALSKRAAFQTDRPDSEWFMRFITNLKLEDYRRVTSYDESVIEDILNVFIWRLYGPDGRGGLFPLREPVHDQKHQELWYQFAEYLDELDRI